LSRRIDKKPSKAIPTAGVRVNEEGHFEMLYNADFFAGLTDEQKQGVLIHEFYHLIFEHVTGRLPDELAGIMSNRQPSKAEQTLFKLWNIGADLAINYHIGTDRLPETCCFPGGKNFEDMPGDMTAEWYYDKLKEKMEEQGKDDADSGDEAGEGNKTKGQGGFDPDAVGQFDCHDDFRPRCCRPI